MHPREAPRYDVTVVCQNHDQELANRTVFLPTIGVAVRLARGVHHGAAAPSGGPESELVRELHDHVETANPDG